MEPSLQFNGNHVERRRMYPVNRRHNLRSNMELSWVGSLDSDLPDVNKVIKQKQFSGQERIKENYQKFVDQQIQSNFQVQFPKYKTIDPEIKPSALKPYSSQLNTVEKSVDQTENDQTLNRQVENFVKQQSNQNSPSSSEKQPRFKSLQNPYKAFYEAQQQKKYNLKSVLDRGALQLPFNPLISKEVQYKYKANDKLENHLRRNLKKSTRY